MYAQLQQQWQQQWHSSGNGNNNGNNTATCYELYYLFSFMLSFTFHPMNHMTYDIITYDFHFILLPIYLLGSFRIFSYDPPLLMHSSVQYAPLSLLASHRHLRFTLTPYLMDEMITPLTYLA